MENMDLSVQNTREKVKGRLKKDATEKLEDGRRNEVSRKKIGSYAGQKAKEMKRKEWGDSRT